MNQESGTRNQESGVRSQETRGRGPGTTKHQAQSTKHKAQSTKHKAQSTKHRPTDAPTTYRLPTDPPTHQRTGQLSSPIPECDVGTRPVSVRRKGRKNRVVEPGCARWSAMLGGFLRRRADGGPDGPGCSVGRRAFLSWRLGYCPSFWQMVWFLFHPWLGIHPADVPGFACIGLAWRPAWLGLMRIFPPFAPHRALETLASRRVSGNRSDAGQWRTCADKTGRTWGAD